MLGLLRLQLGLQRLLRLQGLLGLDGGEAGG